MELVGTHEFEESLHDPVEPHDLLRDHVQVLANRGLASAEPRLQELEVNAHGVERVLDLVGHPGRPAPEPSACPSNASAVWLQNTTSRFAFSTTTASSRLSRIPSIRARSLCQCDCSAWTRSPSWLTRAAISPSSSSRVSSTVAPYSPRARRSIPCAIFLSDCSRK